MGAIVDANVAHELLGQEHAEAGTRFLTGFPKDQAGYSWEANSDESSVKRVLGGSGGALRRSKARGYTDKHLSAGKPVHLVGMEFSIETRNVALVQAETDRPPPP